MTDIRRVFGPPCIALFAVAILVAAVGCGDDDDKTPPTPKTNAEKFDDGVRSLANFGTGLGNSPDVLLAAQMIGVLGNLFPDGLQLAAQVATAPDLPTAAQRVAQLAPRMIHQRPQITKAGISDYFGVYQCDAQDVTEPFPGWVLTEETPNPANSIIMRFDEDCGFIYYDDRGREQVAVGELRMTNVETIPDPNDETLDLPTRFDFEMWAAPAGETIVPILRIAFDAMWDENGDPTSVTVGSPTANSPSNPDASFLGPLVFYFGVGVTDTETNLAVQLFDSTGKYTIRVGAAVAGDVINDELDAVNLQFGFGSTNDPSDPPFLFDVTASNFDVDTDVADIDGSVSLNDVDLAVFSGDTTTVPVNVDTNGDGMVDETDTCPNVQMTFTDDPESTANVCENIEQLFDLLEGIVGSVASLSLQ
jgi:hypothetical protein